MSTCSKISKYTSILELPRIQTINAGDLLIVQTDDTTSTIDFANFLIPLENTTFSGTISAHEFNIATNSTGIASLCSFIESSLSSIYTNISSILEEVRREDVVDLNPLISSQPEPGPVVPTSSRLIILRALSAGGTSEADTPSFPWRTIQQNKTDTQRIPRSVWTTINQLSGNINRSTNKSRVRVQCNVMHSFYTNSDDKDTKSDVPALFRVYRTVGSNTVPVTKSTIFNDLGITTESVEHVDGVSVQNIEYGMSTSRSKTRNTVTLKDSVGSRDVVFYDNIGEVTLTRKEPLYSLYNCSFEVLDPLVGVSNLNITYTVKAFTKQGIMINAPTVTAAGEPPSRGVTTITLTELI